MKTVFTYGGSNPWNKKAIALIEVKQREDNQDLYTVTYGCEVKADLTYSRACSAIGQALLHHLSREAVGNNEGR